jgi:hypothetical protein
LNIRILAFTNTTTTNCILLKVEGFRIGHAVDNLAERAYFAATRADESADSFAAFGGHLGRVLERADRRALLIVG